MKARSVMLRRASRIAIALVLGLALWLVIAQFAPSLVGALAGLLVTALATGMAEAKAPEIISFATGESPLDAIAGDDLARYGDGWTVVFPGELVRDDEPADGTPHLEARAHLVQKGAYDLEETHLQLALEGTSDRAVTVTEIRARILHRESPLVGTLITSPSAGMQEVMPLELRLDETEPVAKSRDGTRVFDDYVLNLSRGEVMVFQVTASAKGSACSWELEIAFTFAGKKRVLRLDRRGAPFRTTPTAPQYARRYNWAWYEHPATLVAQ